MTYRCPTPDRCTARPSSLGPGVLYCVQCCETVTEYERSGAEEAFASPAAGTEAIPTPQKARRHLVYGDAFDDKERADPTWTPTEHEEQSRLFHQCDLFAPFTPRLLNLFAVPNGSSKDRAQSGRFKAEGLRSGVPDVMLAYPSGEFAGLFLEIKRRDAKPSDTKVNQKVWHTRLTCAGYRVEVCKGWYAAWSVICDYLKWEGGVEE